MNGSLHVHGVGIKHAAAFLCEKLTIFTQSPKKKKDKGIFFSDITVDFNKDKGEEDSSNWKGIVNDHLHPRLVKSSALAFTENEIKHPSYKIIANTVNDLLGKKNDGWTVVLFRKIKANILEAMYTNNQEPRSTNNIQLFLTRFQETLLNTYFFFLFPEKRASTLPTRGRISMDLSLFNPTGKMCFYQDIASLAPGKCTFTRIISGSCGAKFGPDGTDLSFIMEGKTSNVRGEMYYLNFLEGKETSPVRNDRDITLQDTLDPESSESLNVRGGDSSTTWVFYLDRWIPMENVDFVKYFFPKIPRSFSGVLHRIHVFLFIGKDIVPSQTKQDFQGHLVRHLAKNYNKISILDARVLNTKDSQKGFLDWLSKCSKYDQTYLWHETDGKITSLVIQGDQDSRKRLGIGDLVCRKKTGSICRILGFKKPLSTNARFIAGVRSL